MIRIRLARVGKKKQPSYRLVVATKESPRDGRFIEILGHYNPLKNPAVFEFNADRTREWIAKGAQPSEAAAKLLAREGIGEAPRRATKPRKEAQTPAEAQAPAPAAAPAAEAPAEERGAEAEAAATEVAEEPATEAPAREPAAEAEAVAEEPAVEETGEGAATAGEEPPTA